MVHALIYPGGMSGQVGELLLLPKSHKAVIPADHVMTPLFPDCPDLPGSLTIERLPKGSMVLCHSALLHARRPKPSPSPASSSSSRSRSAAYAARYLITTAYCEYAERSAPERRFAAHVDTFNPQGEPTGRDYNGSVGWSMEDFCKLAVERGHHRPDEEGGGYGFVFEHACAFRAH